MAYCMMNHAYFRVLWSNGGPRNGNVIINTITKTTTIHANVIANYDQRFEFYANNVYGNVNSPAPTRGSRNDLNQGVYFCIVCNLRSFKKNDFVHHVLSPSHSRAGQGEYFSYFCKMCNATIYGPSQTIMEHTQTVHDQPLTRLPELCTLQSKILKRYKSNAIDEIMFACVLCRKFDSMDPTNRNYQEHCMTCHTMTSSFCPICNVNFSCPSFAFDMHTHSFEHIYIGWRRFDLY